MTGNAVEEIHKYVQQDEINLTVSGILIIDWYLKWVASLLVMGSLMMRAAGVEYRMYDLYLAGAVSCSGLGHLSSGEIEHSALLNGVSFCKRSNSKGVDSMIVIIETFKDPLFLQEIVDNQDEIFRDLASINGGWLVGIKAEEYSTAIDTHCMGK